MPTISLRYFRFFYGYLGNGVWLTLVASMFMAVLDGIGLTMFLPLMQAMDGDTSGGAAAGAGEGMGNMAFLLEAIAATGLGVNLVNLLLIMLGFFVLKGVAKFASEYYRVILRQRFANKMRLNNMRLLARYDYAAFMGADSGRIQNSFSAEVNRVTMAYQHYFVMLQYAIMLLVYAGLASLANPKFALMVGAAGLLSNFAFSKIYKATKTASTKLTEEMHAFQGFLIQSIASFKYLKATGLINKYKDKVEDSIITVEGFQRKTGTLSAIANALREPIIMLIVVVAILVQVLVFGERLGLMILSLLFLYRGLGSLVGAQNAYNMFLSQSGSIDNIEAFGKELTADQEVVGSQPYRGMTAGISLKKLRYTYGEGTVVENLSFDIPHKHTIGIVGASGTGKTTLVNILCGLLKVDRGMLTINGTDANDLDTVAYRAKIGYVTQEAQIFSDTIYNNVSFWDPLTDEVKNRVHAALKLAHADGFVNDLNQGADTVVGINGINLSGGQRQRISIARELYREVDLLILDEATSALDSQSEKLIQENIESLAGRYTILVIAHRLSTIRKADEILFLHPGGKYETGTFSSLMASSPAFKEMVALQSFGNIE
ncbi:ABC transporter ATP-binding protein [Neolewinella aurantiaca]|uniref:ABC transporter ATP-binding protein n=1 Tax=Neolewinella aurantiaca TaxID=2602767 RepID=A0A5C7FJW5_9BACT|nr:ABC transporter ATP-binding protein [Neolewinella aurantiaca]TXF90944.1 ABC transporter ATP-binding protein [Neolewinella aurantiaca]